MDRKRKLSSPQASSGKHSRRDIPEESKSRSDLLPIRPPTTFANAFENVLPTYDDVCRDVLTTSKDRTVGNDRYVPSTYRVQKIEIYRQPISRRSSFKYTPTIYNPAPETTHHLRFVWPRPSSEPYNDGLPLYFSRGGIVAEWSAMKAVNDGPIVTML